MGIEIKGIPQLMKKLNNLVSEEAIMKGIQKGVLRVEGDAKNLCPVDTGALRASITHNLEPSTMSGTVGTIIDYAPYVELGTRYQGAQPYLCPALRNNIDSIKQDIINALKEALRGL